MANEDIVISVNGQNYPFVDTSFPLRSGTDGSNILNLLNKLTPSTTLAAAVLTDDAYFANKNLATTRFPTSWADFIAEYPGGNTQAFEDAFLQNYRQMLGMSTDVNANADGDLTPLGNQGVDAAAIKDQFINSFSHFLANFPYEQNGSVAPDAAGFLTKWAKFMTQTAVVSSASLGTSGLAAFEQIYLAFGFPANEFETKLKAFYDGVLEETGGIFQKGYFIPSLAIDEWLESVRDEYLQGALLSSVGSTATDRVLVIDRILRLLIEMIDVLQKISAAQAQRLTFLTNWQQAYTELLTDIPTFSIGDGTAIDENYDREDTFGNTRDSIRKAFEADFGGANALPGGGRTDAWIEAVWNETTETQKNDWLSSIGASESDAKKEESKMRDKLNPKMQALQEKTRARRSQISDWAKAQQSVINQSQDAANQQTDIATALLQQLSTILASIFR